MSRQPVNLLPAHWRSSNLSLPVPSMALTAVLCVMTIVLGWITAPEAQVIAVAAPPTPAGSNRFQVQLYDDAAYSLAKGSSAHPWHSVFQRLAAVLGKEARIDAFDYSNRQRELNISGEIADTTGIPILMAALDGFDWLSEPDPHRLDLNAATNLYTFEIKAKVAPLVIWEEGP